MINCWKRETVIVDRIVNDIDGIVKIVRFPGWQKYFYRQEGSQQKSPGYRYEKKRIKDQDVFNKAHSYAEQYY